MRQHPPALYLLGDTAMIFIDNKYTRWYFNIITKANARILPTEIYREVHHIVPKSLGGSNSKDNLVALTAREHFVCHWLLTKMVTGHKNLYKMLNAAGQMISQETKYQRRYIGKSRKFELIKQRLSREKQVKFSGTANPMFGRNHTKEAKERMSKSRIGRIVSIETRAKLKLVRKHQGPNYKLRGENNAMHKPGVKELREKLFLEKYGVKGPGLVLWTCEHCHTSGKGLGNYSRYHGDNCKIIKPRLLHTCQFCNLQTTSFSNYKRYHDINCKRNNNKY
jgi:hypothetical protein